MLSVGAEATTSEVSRRLSGRELLKKLRLNLDVQTPLGKYLVNIADDADVERAKNQFAGIVALIVGQQQRLPMISQVVHRGLDKVNGVDPDLDKLLAALAAGYPDLNFQDPQVLKVLHRNSALLVNTTAGVLAEPNSLGLFALIEPELAARFYLVSLQDRLAARGDWDPLGNARLKDQIDQLDRALSVSDPDSGQRLVRLQNLLKDMGILVPNTAEGGRILVDKVFNRFQEILDGKNLPATVDVVSRSQQTLLGKFFDKLDARIAQLQAPAPTTGQTAPAATTANPIAR